MIGKQREAGGGNCHEKTWEISKKNWTALPPSLSRSAGSRRPFLVGWGDPGNKLSCNHFGVAATPLSLSLSPARESTKLVLLLLLPPSKVGENRSFGLLPFVAKLYSLHCLSALSPPLPLSALL